MQLILFETEEQKFIHVMNDKKTLGRLKTRLNYYICNTGKMEIYIIMNIEYCICSDHYNKV